MAWLTGLVGAVTLSMTADTRATTFDSIAVSWYNQTEQLPLYDPLVSNLEAGTSDLGTLGWNVRQQYWNDLGGDWSDIGTGLQMNLMNSAGAATTASVTWGGLQVSFGDWPPTTSDGIMMNGALMSDGGNFGPPTTTVNFFDLPAHYVSTGYRVVVYGEWDFTGAAQTLSLADAGGTILQSLFMEDQQAMDPGGFIDPLHYIDATTSGVGNYVVFDVQHLSDISIIADAGPLGISYISGIQIIAIPAPGALALLGVAGFLTARRRDRRD
ncbi:MAG: hypothetical protein EA377_06225 [Phycisphaerales bacterium]|nr:MAG: hypothetical protein EA377_06225 [Phycisphaerales bacterium]